MTHVRRDVQAMALAAGMALAVLPLTGCDDGTGVVIHADPAGFSIEVDGEEALRYLEGVGGALALSLENGQSYDVTVVFLDAEGDPLPYDPPAVDDVAKTLRVTIGNTSILSWTGGPAGTTALDFDGVLGTSGSGSTSLELCLLHDDHCDYDSPQLTVTVSNVG